jgi:bacteriocin-like protein
MIYRKNTDENNDVTIAGTDFFTDTESFLNELTDDELQQVIGGVKSIDDDDDDDDPDDDRDLPDYSYHMPSYISMVLCN